VWNHTSRLGRSEPSAHRLEPEHVGARAHRQHRRHFTLAVELVILRTRLLPAWAGWLGLVTVVLSLASLLYLVADGANGVLQTINIAGSLTAMVFVLIVCVCMLRRSSAAPEIGYPGAGSRC
jgi:hypothetical protein